MVTLFLGYSEAGGAAMEGLKDNVTSQGLPLWLFPRSTMAREKELSVFIFSQELLLPAKPFFPTAHSARNPSVN